MMDHLKYLVRIVMNININCFNGEHHQSEKIN